MSSYTDIFSGNFVSPSYASFNAIALTALNSPYTLVWPLAFQETTTNTVVSQIVNVSASADSLYLVLPNAELASVGMAILFVNTGAHTFTVRLADATTTLITLISGASIYIYLTDNSTTNGTWSNVLFGGGTSAVVSIAVTSASPTQITVSGSPILTAGTITLTLGADLLALTSLGSATGILAKTGTSSYTTRTITGTAGQITLTNGNSVSGNPTISLPSAVSGINSLIVGNLRLGYTGTNYIDTSDSTAILMPITLSMRATGSTPQAIRFYDNDNSNYVSLQAGATIASNVAWVLPTADGTSGQVLSTNGSGTLSWSSAGSGTVASVAGTLNRITSTGGTNPIIDISASYVGQSSITTLGTVGTGTWQATPVVVTYGGTGATTFTAYGVILGGTTNTGLLQSTATAGTAGQCLVSNGAAAIPSWQSFPIGQNMVVNGDFQVWQRGAGGSAVIAVGASTTAYTADRWQLATGANQASTATQVAGATSGSYIARVQRNSGQTGTGSITFTNSLTRSMCIGVAGSAVTISFSVLKGADFSATSNLLHVKLFTGTGTSDVSVLSSFTGQATVIDQTVTLTSSLVRYSYTTAVLGSTITQLAIEFYWDPTGTASTNDYFSVSDVQIQLGTNASSFERKNFQQQLQDCLPFYFKTFDYTIAPAQATASYLGAFGFSMPVTNIAYVGLYSYPTPMRAAPTIVYYNVVSANTKWYNANATADSGTPSTGGAANNREISITNTTVAGDLASYTCYIHVTADADVT